MEFRSLEEPQIEEIHRRQNSDCTHELSDMLDNEPAWAPMSLQKINVPQA